MSISLYQRYFDCLSTDEENLIGICDNRNVVVACTQSKYIGYPYSDIKVKCIKTELDFDKTDKYCLFLQQEDKKVLEIVKQSLSAFKSVNREFDDEEFFFQQVVNEKIENISWKAQCLGISDEEIRVVFVINVSSKNMQDAKEIIADVAPVRDGDCLFTNAANELVFIRRCKSEPSNTKLMNIAMQISTGITESLFEQPSIGIGGVSEKLADLSKSYKAAISALDVGYIFENRNKIYAHMSLGVSRLVTSVPIEKCKAFLNEVLKEDILREIDNETMNTVQRFLDCDLNISLAARELYIHRNTLVFRLDKLKSLTGLDVRKFEDAMLLKMAMLIHRYLRTSRGGNSL